MPDLNGTSLYRKAAEGVSVTTAVVVTYLLFPFVHGTSNAWIQAFTVEYYSAGLAGLTGLAWTILCALFLYFISQLTVGTAVRVGLLAIGTRLRFY